MERSQKNLGYSNVQHTLGIQDHQYDHQTQDSFGQDQISDVSQESLRASISQNQSFNYEDPASENQKQLELFKQQLVIIEKEQDTTIKKQMLNEVIQALHQQNGLSPLLLQRLTGLKMSKIAQGLGTFDQIEKYQNIKDLDFQRMVYNNLNKVYEEYGWD